MQFFQLGMFKKNIGHQCLKGFVLIHILSISFEAKANMYYSDGIK